MKKSKGACRKIDWQLGIWGIGAIALFIVLCWYNFSPYFQKTEIITSKGNELISFENMESYSFEDLGNITIYKTRKVQEYLDFLQRFDYQNNEIISISTGIKRTDTNLHRDFFVVTYKKREQPVDIKYGKVALFKTIKEKDYLTFLKNFPNDKYEILDTSVYLNTMGKLGKNTYMITYIEKIQYN